MPPKRRVEAAEDKKEVPTAEKTKKEKIKENCQPFGRGSPYPRRLSSRII